MILGSHNTMTYLKPRKWWMWFGRFMAKCQKEDYKTQYKLGARWFDLRVSIPKQKDGSHGKPIFSHGLMDFKGTDPCEVLEWLNTKNNAYCRIILEKGNGIECELFKFYVKQWMNRYTNLKIVQIAKKGEWKNMLEPNAETPFALKDAYASANGHYPQYENLHGILRSKTWSGLLLDDLYPWIYAKLHNRKNIERHKGENIVLLLDFIGLR